jgi:hypothetical protein
MVLRILEHVDLHHGEVSCKHPYSTLEVIGYAGRGRTMGPVIHKFIIFAAAPPVTADGMLVV